MAKRLSVEEATRRVIDNINLLKDAENVDIEKHMNRYASLRELDGEEREEVYKEIAFALFGDYKPQDEEEEEVPELDPEEEPQRMEEEPQETLQDEPQVAPQMMEEEEAPELRAREKLESVAFSVLPPRAEIVPLVSPEVATINLLDRLLSLWDGATATIETAWEMYLAPVVMVLLSLLGAVWAVARGGGYILLTGGKMAYRGARVALPVMGAITIQAWGMVVVIALLGAKMALQGARVAYQGATIAAKEARRGWELREEMCREWREEVA